MVLARALLSLVALAGCGQSLFDNNVGTTGGSGTDGGGSDSGDGNNVATMCPAGCIGDAAADIDGSRPGWRYLEDARDRTWVPMTAGGGGSHTGAVSPNAIETCAANAGAPGCVALPGALLVTTAGMAASADPAVEFTVPSNQVVQLSLRVYVPSGQPEQRVRLYRNSREDSLLTVPAIPGQLLERSLAVDALAGDRFLVAIAPTAAGATQVALHFFINTTADSFPATCNLAVDFAAATGNTVDNLCAADVTYYDYDLSSPNDAIPPKLAAGPYAELGMAADIPLTEYYVAADIIQRTGDTTTQFWVRHDAFDSSYPYNAYPFSDIDLDATGGLSIGIYDSGAGVRRLSVYTCDTINMPSPGDFTTNGTNVAYPNDANWHFVRIVHTVGSVRICVDGTRVGSFVVPAGKLQGQLKPYFGKDNKWLPVFASFDGGVDDIRSFTTALACE